MTPKFREYSQLLQRLKFLVDKNRGDSEDAFHVRDLMAECWRGLSDEDCEEAAILTDSLGLTESV